MCALDAFTHGRPRASIHFGIASLHRISNYVRRPLNLRPPWGALDDADSERFQQGKYCRHRQPKFRFSAQNGGLLLLV